MGETLRMSLKERERLVEVRLVAGGSQTLAGAARRLRLSYRQMKRVWGRYREAGDGGLVHRARGRPSNRRKPAEERERCVRIYRRELDGFGPTLASEKLAERGLVVDHETLRRWLVAEGLWKVQGRRRKHRRWRARKEHFGDMVQLDGSHHDWFQRGDGTRHCLVAMIDDATSRRMSRMSSQETTADAMQLLWRWIERYGCPRSLYVDRKSVYVTHREPTLEEQLADEEPLTAFGKACKKLGIEIIVASSPQAKGRIERSHGVYQDRLVKEMRLRALESCEAVNALLEQFDEQLNRRFAVEPAAPQDHHRPVPQGVLLADVFVFEETRTLQNDWTLRYQNRWFQVAGPKPKLPPTKSKVLVQRRLDGSLHILYRGQELRCNELPERPRRQTAPVPPTAPERKPWKPPADHPWRKPFSPNAPSLEAR